MVREGASWDSAENQGALKVSQRGESGGGQAAQGSNPRLLHWQGILEAPGARSNSTHSDSGADGRGHTAAMELVAVAAAMVTSLSPDVSYPVFGPSNSSVKLPMTDRKSVV